MEKINKIPLFLFLCFSFSLFLSCFAAMLKQNVEWCQDHLDTTLNILHLSVSDHALLWLRNHDKYHVKNKLFKFINYTVDIEGYANKVSTNWRDPIQGRHMYVLWEKLKRLKSALKKLRKPIMNGHQNILKAREDLQMGQHELLNDRMNSSKIEEIKRYTEELVKWNELEENILRKKANIEWLWLEDGNNSYFHASLKSKHNEKSMRAQHKDDGAIITNQTEIEKTDLEYYGGLMGNKDNNLIHIDVAAMREWDQLTNEQRHNLVASVSEQNILSALNGICDMKTP